jgi:hypothetical protein
MSNYVKQGHPALVTIGQQRLQFTCHVCSSKVFAGYNVKLNTATAYRLGDQFAESAINLACQDCGYIHAFLHGKVQVWPVENGYPE